MKNIILCGGSGTRLWPLSRTLLPKQFLQLFNSKSLFQLTVERNYNLCSQQVIISNAEQYFLALDQLEELKLDGFSFLLEPIGRNTAPAIGLVSMMFDENDILLVTPSDHLIKNNDAYYKAVEQAYALAVEDNLVTFGIPPHLPETGFGYIQSDGEDVKCFHEKPDLKTAISYLEGGDYFWNSGIFCFKAGVFLEELQKYSPRIYEKVKTAYKNSSRNAFVTRVKHDDMSEIPSNSIDYAVLEKSDRVKMVASHMEWSDMGSFDALSSELKSDESYEIDCKNNFYYSENPKKVIAAIGLENFVVIDTNDALLITKKDKTQQVKELVNQIQVDYPDVLKSHSTVHRPWGTFTVLEEANGYKIKRIVVKPGKSLSLQKHFHRNEHWIVVSGTATVTVGDEKKLIRPNESTYIKMGEVHRLANEGKIPVVLIEAQVGEYTGEDDIVRIEDDFERV